MFATLAGSYPRPAEVPPAGALRLVLRAQADAGLGLLSDGIVHQSDDESALREAWTATRDAAAAEGIELPIKLAILGPWARVALPVGARRAPSIAPDPAVAEGAAARLTRALAAVLAEGCPVVEIHEPAATLPTGSRGDAAFASVHRLLLEGLPGDSHATLAITGGDAEAVGAEILFGLGYRSYLFDLIGGPDSWRTIARAPGDRGIILGVADATGGQRAGLEEVAWAAGYAASLGSRGMERVGLSPAGGLGGLDPVRARAVIELLGEAARLLVGDPEVMARRFDPRAVDLRSAALGEYRPDRRGRPTGR